MILSIIYWIVFITLLLIGMISIGMIWIYGFSLIYHMVYEFIQSRKKYTK